MALSMICRGGVSMVSYQPVFARHTYEHTSIMWGYRHVDILAETPDGSLLLDVRRFHELESNSATS